LSTGGHRALPMIRCVVDVDPAERLPAAHTAPAAITFLTVLALTGARVVDGASQQGLSPNGPADFVFVHHLFPCFFAFTRPPIRVGVGAVRRCGPSADPTSPPQARADWLPHVLDECRSAGRRRSGLTWFGQHPELPSGSAH
jgi:hypothetical protein